MRITTKKLTAQEMVDQEVTHLIYVNPKIRDIACVGLFTAIFLGAVFASFSGIERVRALGKPKCSDYLYHEQAQEAFDYAKKFPSIFKNYKVLDRDNDGIACENLPLRGNNDR